MIRLLPLLAVWVTLILTGCSSSNDSEVAARSTEGKLAAVQRGRLVAQTDPLVGRFNAALSRLEGKCPEDRARLADMGLAGHQILIKKGLTEELVAVFENWGKSIPETAADGDVGPCADILAAYVTLRIGG